MSSENIVVVVMDTAKFDAVSEVRTAGETTLDRLATDGCEYTSAFANAPWSLPSHASLFTGTYTSKHGTHAGHMRLEDRLETLPGVFRREGYETVAVSNNTWISEEFGFGRGFEEFWKSWQYIQSGTDLGRIAQTKDGADRVRALARSLVDGNPVVNTVNAVYGRFLRRRHDDGAKRATEWIRTWLSERDDDRPFFLFVNYLEPHLEYTPPERFATQFLPAGVSYEAATEIPQDAFGYIAGTVDISEREFEILRALYLAEIAYLDHRIGELERALAEHDEWGDTLFVVTGDHGENIGDHGLMDHQYCLYDTLLHVPLILHGGRFTGRSDDHRLAQLVDLAPTLLDAADIDAPAFREQTQGRSLHPAAETDPRDRLFAEYLTPQPSMEALERRTGDLPDDVYGYDRSLRAIRTADWKLVRASDGSSELYDIENDPAESEDVSSSNRDVVGRLESELDAWLESFDHADHAGAVEMREETRKRLEDLGYLQ
jgi:arylsulfatase A-like enzyme